MNEVDKDCHLHLARAGFFADAVDLVVVAVHQRDPVARARRVAA